VNLTIKHLLLPVEVEARELVPIMRAIVAKKLIHEYSFSQTKASKLLGITQAAVSNYLRSTRGSDVVFEVKPDVQRAADDLAMMLVSGVEGQRFIIAFNEACSKLRSNRVMCDLHKRVEPDLDTDGCHVCEPGDSEPIQIQPSRS
jgi:predicted transcriptional regulator